MRKLYLVYPVRGLCTLPFALQVLLDTCPLAAFGDKPLVLHNYMYMDSTSAFR